jgi:hypothetical protein
MAQAPQSFEYQAVVRDGSGAILISQNVGIQITIKQGSPSGANVYQETFASITNLYGLVNLQIGTGTTGDDFSTIDWAAGSYFIEVALDVTGGTSYTVMGTSQLLSVPYALHAKTVEINDACSLFSYYYADRDNDGFGDAFNLVFSCSQPTGFVVDNTDCNDNNPNTNPGETEICNGIDDNCDGNIDEGFTLIEQYPDMDGDGYGDFNSPPSYFCNLEPGFATNNNDCDVIDPSINPGATEVCNGIDDNCDGQIDEGFDVDGDGFTTCQGDCDDNNPTINPGATEICGNGIDENCDGFDMICPCNFYLFFRDADSDGYGSLSYIVLQSNIGQAGYVQAGLRDCDDTNPLIRPFGTDVLANGLDEDCDGVIDSQSSTLDSDGDILSNVLEATLGTNTLSFDSDGDGIGDYTEYVHSLVFGNDVDGDGTPNYLDMDSDGDGIVDGVNGLMDNNCNGVPNYLDMND